MIAGTDDFGASVDDQALTKWRNRVNWNFDNKTKVSKGLNNDYENYYDHQHSRHFISDPIKFL